MPLLHPNAKGGGNVKGVAASNSKASSSSSCSSKSSSKSSDKGGSAKSKTKSDKPKKEKKDKKDMGPPKPKTARNAYISENKEQFKKDNPEVKALKIAHALGDQWKELDDEAKKKYETAAKRELEEWQVEYKKWEKDNPDRVEEIKAEKAKKKEANATKKAENGGKPKAKKKKRAKSDDDENETSEDEQPKQKKSKADPDKPKRPASSYLRFANAKRPELKAQGIDFKELGKKLGEMWRELKDSEKEPYVKAYTEEMVKWKKRDAEYKNESENEHAESDEAVNGKENGDGPAAANGKAASGDEAEAEPAAAAPAAANGEAEAADAKNDAE